MAKKNVVLFINAIRPATFESLEEYAKLTGKKFEPIVLVDKRIQAAITERNGQYVLEDMVTVLSANFDKPRTVRKVLGPYMDRIVAITSQYENSILELKKAIPLFDHLDLPLPESLVWATEKKHMRAMVEAKFPELVPKYMEISNAKKRTIKQIEANIPYPLIIKPSGLEGSLLVSLARNRTELERNLVTTFQEIKTGYDRWIKRQRPSVLVESFMDGDMYTVDTYISKNGEFFHTPLVKVVTGYRVGYDDFFGYMQTAPAGLSRAEVSQAYKAAESSCRALGLKSVTAHVELMKTTSGWKLIELGPRIGGYRHDIYNFAYGINHIMNDILNRAGLEPSLNRKAKKYTAVMKIYASKEGRLKKIWGVDAVQQLPSFVWINQDIKIGDKVEFARNNGDPIFEITLSNRSKQQFETDVAALRKKLRFVVEEDGV